MQQFMLISQIFICYEMVKTLVCSLLVKDVNFLTSTLYFPFLVLQLFVPVGSKSSFEDWEKVLLPQLIYLEYKISELVLVVGNH